MKYYFAYGSNMDVMRLERERLNKEGIYTLRRFLGKLEGYELVFNKPSAYFIGAGAANIRLKQNSSVYGTLNLMPAAGLDLLDQYENVSSGQYERFEVSVVDCDAGVNVAAITYISIKNNIEGLMPRAGYMNYLLGGSDLLPKEYVDYLKTIPLMSS